MEDFPAIFAKGIKDKFPNMSYQKMQELASHTEILNIPKRSVYIKTGQYSRKIVFVIKGLFRGLYMKDDTEVTFWFREEFTVFAAYESILANMPTKMSYEALEDSVIAVIDYDLLKEMSKTDLDFANSIIVVLEGLLKATIERIASFTSMSPEERYLELLNKTPDIINRVPQQHLASFIGITPVSLSRLKGRVKSK